MLMRTKAKTYATRKTDAFLAADTLKILLFG
jgi:hypothetical protein